MNSSNLNTAEMIDKNVSNNRIEPAAAKKRKLSLLKEEDSLADIELSILKIKIEKLEKLIGKLEAEKEQILEENNQQISTLNATINKLHKDDAKIQIDQLNFTLHDFGEKIKALETEKQEFQETIKNLKDEILSMKNIKMEIKDTVEEETQYPQTIIEKLKIEKQNLMDENIHHKERISQIETNLTNLKTNNEKAETQICSLKATICIYSTKIKDFEEEKQKLKEKNKQKNNKIEKLKAEIKKLKNETSKPPSKVKGNLPILSAEEQVTVDDETNVFHFKNGARVYALWRENNKYYPAIIDSFDDESGRYKVIYAEDQSIRNISKDGIIPLWMIKNGAQIYVEEKNEYEEKFVFKGKILGIPSIENNKEWHRGIYKIEIQNREFPVPISRDFKWSDIFFTYTQFKNIIKAAKNSRSYQEKANRFRRSTGPATPEPQRKTPSQSPAKENKNIELQEDSRDSQSDVKNYY